MGTSIKTHAFQILLLVWLSNILNFHLLSTSTPVPTDELNSSNDPSNPADESVEEWLSRSKVAIEKAELANPEPLCTDPFGLCTGDNVDSCYTVYKYLSMPEVHRGTTAYFLGTDVEPKDSPDRYYENWLLPNEASAEDEFLKWDREYKARAIVHENFARFKDEILADPTPTSYLKDCEAYESDHFFERDDCIKRAVSRYLDKMIVEGKVKSEDDPRRGFSWDWDRQAEDKWPPGYYIQSKWIEPKSVEEEGLPADQEMIEDIAEIYGELKKDGRVITHMFDTRPNSWYGVGGWMFPELVYCADGDHSCMRRDVWGYVKLATRRPGIMRNKKEEGTEEGGQNNKAKASASEDVGAGIAPNHDEEE
ncbi:hypothetical protein BJ508DRAFT_320135 [Ascobolus immersus RN42]|uniref:Uncharacterized protein n=1 Tax=Ascobolus immersus RN42 TaxID=1160509 RepID=A0A3N4IPA9_ASCIM|nr:hypothetical protein BJ508DRAFT_320135 [Ascobolus immersus RN42]